MIIEGKEYIYEMNGKQYHCALSVTMDYLGGKWKIIVLWYLRSGKMRFGELKQRIPDITEKMLSLQLKQLVNDGLISRKVFAEVPPRVEYDLTEQGESLKPLLNEIAKWGRKKGEQEGKIKEVKPT